ncbi:hypothetical protein SHKM778_39380 [Streptomyces sp. KM77-8]|uniref:Uncharacterized protein n=1 Tax=Streptomyces haneummycinicus TaxID=3074435 RepID=A0AAT9HJW8_9ACTN
MPYRRPVEEAQPRAEAVREQSQEVHDLGFVALLAGAAGEFAGHGVVAGAHARADDQQARSPVRRGGPVGRRRRCVHACRVSSATSAKRVVPRFGDCVRDTPGAPLPPDAQPRCTMTHPSAPHTAVSG